MHTPKYNTILNRNTTSTSPLRSAPKNKFYSAEEVHKILTTTYQPKIKYLMQQLQDRQQIIARLNNKLNENDEKLIQQSSVIESQLKRTKDSGQVQSFVVSTVNQLINDKTKQMWDTLMGQFKQITAKVQGELDFKRIEAIVQFQMQKLKAVVVEFIDSHKKKSNAYWQKIKQALNKINSKVTTTEKSISDLTAKLQAFHQLRNRDRETINELHNSKNVVKNLIQLKKSVENIYDNYQAILSLQKGLKKKIEDDHADSLWHEPQFLKATSKIVMPNEEIVALEYSREEGFLDKSKEAFEDWRPYENVTQAMVSPLKKEDNNRSASDILGLQKTTPFKGNDNSELFSLNNSNQMNSKIHNSTIMLNFSLQTRKQMSQGARERLLELIEAKNLAKPLQVRYDEQINYLKSIEGNYLFDIKGNMFKVTPNDLDKLEGEGIVVRTKSRKISLSASKVKRTNC